MPVTTATRAGWKVRAAAVVSALWILGSLLVVAEDTTWSGDFYWPLFIQLSIPLVILWGVGWVIAGFRSSRP